ncbi:N-acetyltransferase family protein [Methylocystis bryophila]|uniref:GNAT family N-acetyltransferase n=1 Tax=Methylocystis bryophila TaxID=655015 RepID=UPI0026AF221E
MVTIRDVAPGDKTAWLTLWGGYCDFYRAEIPPAVTEASWKRLVDPRSDFVGRVAELEGEIVGFVLLVIHPCSWTIAPVCYLEDLYVAPKARGLSVGRALIEDVLSLARQNAWARVYWHTEADNAAARRLYDRFGKADGFVRYQLRLDDASSA